MEYKPLDLDFDSPKAILIDRLERLALRREMEGIYTDADLIHAAIAFINLMPGTSHEQPKDKHGSEDKSGPSEAGPDNN